MNLEAKQWSQDAIIKIWTKGKIVPNNDPAVFRKDECGAWIRFESYGNRDAKYGWEIDHIIPESRGGSDYLRNLQPLHWKNNAAKGDGTELQCATTS